MVGGVALWLLSIAMPLAAGLLALSGCSRTMSEEDCRKVAENVREAWARETKDVHAPEGPNTDKAAGVIKSEGEKLVAEWSAECRSKLLEQPVSSDEIKCLLGAKTLAELRGCTRVAR
jgi:hypothetical protein